MLDGVGGDLHRGGQELPDNAGRALEHVGHVVATGSGAVGDYMRMEIFRGGVLRYHAFFTLDRFNRYSIALPSVLGTRGLQVSVYQYWAGPASAARKSI